ncbi:MAG: DoxX family protein [Candidatus Berkiella sp.]
MKIYTGTLNFLHKLVPLADVGLRLWIFKAFFFSGWIKTKNWASTIYLFENEYHVPLLSAEVAAYLGTAAELCLPIILIFGLCTRVCASFLFLLNLTMVLCYPFLWTADGALGLQQHITWGLMVIVIMAYGPSKISLDYLIKKKFPNYEY